jgi:lysozyme
MYNIVKERIAKHEGKINKIYKDSLGLKTFGIGHLVLEDDDLEEGVEYSDEVVMEYFEHDFKIAVADAHKFIDENTIPENVFGVVIEMCFQLGYPRLCGFKKFKAALENNDLVEAHLQMLDSRWAKQTPQRANQLAEIVRDA